MGPIRLRLLAACSSPLNTRILPHGAQLSDSVARVDVPFRGNWLLRVDTPFHRLARSQSFPASSSAQGLGNLSAILGWRAYNTPEYAFLIGAASSFPTASDDSLGSGKYTVGPIHRHRPFPPSMGVLPVRGLPNIPVSAGGDPSRSGHLSHQCVTYRSIRSGPTVGGRIVQGVWQVNWEQKAKTSMTFEVELGRNIVGRWGVYATPRCWDLGKRLSSEPMIGMWRSALATCSNRFEDQARYCAPECSILQMTFFSLVLHCARVVGSYCTETPDQPNGNCRGV